MLLGGLWHGASWRFVFWGAMHGVGLAIHKASKGKLDKIPEDYVGTFFAWFMKIIKIPANAIKSIIKYTPTLTMSNFLPWALTFHFVIFLWVFFRANDVLFDVMMPVFNGVSTIQVPVKFTVSGFDVAWIMIQKVLTQTDFGFFATFFQARYIWVILIVIGFLMHTTPAKWNTNIMNLFVKVPFIAKVFIFIIVVQLVIQFKSEFVQPFIYFQF